MKTQCFQRFFQIRHEVFLYGQQNTVIVAEVSPDRVKWRVEVGL